VPRGVERHSLVPGRGHPVRPGRRRRRGAPQAPENRRRGRLTLGHSCPPQQTYRDQCLQVPGMRSAGSAVLRSRWLRGWFAVLGLDVHVGRSRECSRASASRCMSADREGDRSSLLAGTRPSSRRSPVPRFGLHARQVTRNRITRFLAPPCGARRRHRPCRRLAWQKLSEAGTPTSRRRGLSACRSPIN
jgi:hypothetical protein